jgi:hypothetical protein
VAYKFGIGYYYEDCEGCDDGEGVRCCIDYQGRNLGTVLMDGEYWKGKW